MLRSEWEESMAHMGVRTRRGDHRVQQEAHRDATWAMAKKGVTTMGQIDHFAQSLQRNARPAAAAAAMQSSCARGFSTRKKVLRTVHALPLQSMRTLYP